MTAHSKWKNLGFNFGSHLCDPGSLLRGEGKLISRHSRVITSRDCACGAARRRAERTTVIVHKAEARASNY